ncbi:hypothetical protein DIC66_21570 [Rhodoferax lacus]|uniref:Thiolase N-terminal domain-containing protein n=1 Tax=Rhodoferax lacus TaxID=2184758 RepID=A0A3E1R648_9BURK|nr:hypothetical protein [Rhodoferax lacus]RFO94804.1 hypothetical protein DIC66_21570 [Rhodoferax lacus]
MQSSSHIHWHIRRSLNGVSATDWGAALISKTLSRSAQNAMEAQAVIMSNAMQVGCKMNTFGQSAINADVPVVVPALTTIRVFGYGTQSVVSAARENWSGMFDCAFAVSMDNMDFALCLPPQAHCCARRGDDTHFDSTLHNDLNDALSGEHAGWNTQDLVVQCRISRAGQDSWALGSGL